MSRIRLDLGRRRVWTVLFLYTMFLLGFLWGADSVDAARPLSVVSVPDWDFSQDVAVSQQNSESLLILPSDKEEAEPAPAQNQPQAVIYCTHTSEEYSGQKRLNGTAGGVLAAAKSLANSLEQEGIGCILLEQVFDAPDWNNAYGNSLNALEQVKKEHPDIELFVDVHRDSPVEGLNTHYSDSSGDYARMMLIIGSNDNLPHPDWQANRDFAYALENRINADKPDLMRQARIYSGRYNQHMGRQAILVEIGSSENTQAEAENSAAYLGKNIAAVLREQKAE